MQAIQITQFGSEEVLKLVKNLEIPKPSAGQVVIKVSSIGINPVETYQRAGGFGPLPFPWTPGSDCSGTVHAVGTGVTKVKVGQRVYTTKTVNGAYTSHAVANEAHVHNLIDKLSFEDGATLGVPYFTAFDVLFQHDNCKAGETVLIHGASGGVGVAAIQLAKTAGLEVIGTAGTEVGLKAIKELGCDHVFNHRESDYQTKIKEAFPNGINIVLEMFADRNAEFDCSIVCEGGRIMVIGCRGVAKMDFIPVMLKHISIKGVLIFMNTDKMYAEGAKCLEALAKGGKIRPRIWKRLKLEEACEGHKEMIHNTGICGKIILNVD